MALHHQLLLASWGLPTTTWLVMWSVLAALTVLLLVVLRTRWSKAKPWRRYAVLSLWVHVLLACGAMTVRIVTGAPDAGEGEPIRVAVLPMVVEEEQTPQDELIPDWEQPSDPPLVAPDLTPLEAPPLEPAEQLEPGPDVAAIEQVTETTSETPPTPAPPLDAPPLLAAPEPKESPAAESNKQVEQESQKAEPKQAAPTPAAPRPAPVSPPVQPSVPSTYADRFAENRDQIAAKGGGSEQTERAVRAALGWLANAQSENGGWDASRFGAGHERSVLGHDRRGAGANADTGVTGLALLAFLGSGHTHRGGDYPYEVGAALEYLRGRQRSNGSLAGDAQVFAQMYCHSMATFAVCEAYALTRDPRLEPMAKAAVRFTLSMQHPTDGGWRYRRGDTGDTSQLGWQLMTLKSAELAGIHVPASTWTRVGRFLRRVKRGSAGGLASYRPDSPASRTMTAEAMFCRQLLQMPGANELNSAAAREAAWSIAQELPSTSRRNLYYWYYATLALHQGRGRSDAATEAWEAWNQALTTVLITTQQGDGSWTADTTWGGYGGRVYTTALSAMCLEVYYRYSPADESGELARRRQWQAVHR
jgi:outer membrane biosynthesis protein TonB